MNPISFIEIEAFARVQGIAISPLEVEVVRALDRKRLELVAEEERNGRAAGKRQ